MKTIHILSEAEKSKLKIVNRNILNAIGTMEARRTYFIEKEKEKNDETNER